MKNLMRLCMLLLTLCTSISLQAQKSVEARKVLDATANKLTAMKAVKASFSITGSGQSASGTICLSGKKYKVTMADMTTWFDGKTQWTYVPANEEVNVSEPTPAEQASMNPYSFLSLYKKGYNYSLKKKSPNYEVHLKAENPKASIPEVKVLLARDYTPLKVELRQGKQWLTITVSSLQGNQQFPAGTFTFPKSKYPKAEIIDLR